jgi:transketolase
LAGLRAIPNLTVIRPADANETAEAWAFAIQHDGPTLFVLTRQNVPHLDRSNAQEPGVAKGAYILSEADGGTPEVILIGTGSEVSLCMGAQQQLRSQGVSARVVSMPSWNLFAAQNEAYRESVLPRAIKKRITVEAGSPFGWCQWAGDEGAILGIDHYGASAPGEEIMKQFGFTAERVTTTALRLLGKA